MNGLRALGFVLAAAVVGVLPASPTVAEGEGAGNEPEPNTPIEHIIVLMQENHSFDNYFGTYPGADGIPEGTCMPVEPTDPNTDCVEPFHIGDQPVLDLAHNGSIHQAQYNDGRMDSFVAAHSRNNVDGGLAMGYYDDRDLPIYWNVADEYVLFDRFFSSAAGGSVWNHLYWVTGTPGNFEEDAIPPAGFGDLPTIFDRLQERRISWKFYVQNYDAQITYRNRVEGDRGSQVVWVPLLGFDRYLDDPELFSHIVDLDEYFEDLNNGTLPAVSYIVPSGASEHPPGSIRAGQRFVKTLITELMRSDAWNSAAFMWTYDDWGGWYDHVPPPRVDEYGYGFRVPALLVSAYARRGHVNSTELDYTSILKFIEENWGLKPLAERDAKANSIAGAFDFTREPREPVFLSAVRGGDEDEDGPSRAVILAGYSASLALTGLIIAGAALQWVLVRRRRATSGPESAREDTEP